MQMHEAWRMEYRKRPYARQLTQAELNKRIRDIFLNLLRVTPEAKIGVFVPDKRRGIWWEKWTHVLDEMQYRHGPYPNGFDRAVLHSEPFPDFASDLARKAAAKMATLGLKPGSVLIKLGKKEHMQALVERGSLRLQAASYFSRPEHNSAVRDDEMSLPISLTVTREELLQIVRNPLDVPEDLAEQRIDIEFATGADYWLYCLTRSVEPRLFVDFNAEACVVIRKPAIFADRLRRRAREVLPPSDARDAKANYVDPLLPKSPKIFIPFSKPFGYAYQDEYRFCWLPKEPVERLAPVNLEIGNLEGIADLVSLDDQPGSTNPNSDRTPTSSGRRVKRA